MKTRLLFQEDSYLREFEARVVGVKGDAVFLDSTAFHPTPYGGLDTDTGYLEGARGPARVLKAIVEGDEVAHIVERPLFSVGDLVRGVIDWDRRYSMMKLHTFSHILAAILYERHGVLVTGGHITQERAREDFDVGDVADWKSIVREAFEESLDTARRCIDVKIYWMKREEAMKIPGLVKLAERLPPQVDTLRIVEIPGVDIQADGGPHVRNTCEIGTVEIEKMESKGKRRKRLYYKLVE